METIDQGPAARKPAASRFAPTYFIRSASRGNAWLQVSLASYQAVRQHTPAHAKTGDEIRAMTAAGVQLTCMTGQPDRVNESSRKAIGPRRGQDKARKLRAKQGRSQQIGGAA